MGKMKRARNKLHITSTTPKKQEEPNTTSEPEYKSPLLVPPAENPFAGMKIDLSNLNKLKTDDLASVKSFKSIKSQIGTDKALSKKDKLKLKREVLLRKIDTVNQMKKELKVRKKRKANAIIGDTNALYDALPDLQSLLKSKSEKKAKEESTKKKGVQKQSKRKKNLVKGVQVFKHLFKNKEFNKDPIGVISEHVKAVVENNQLK